MKNSLRSILAIAVISFLGAGFAAAADKADTKTESKVAKCCAKAKADGKTCDHACCVEAAKAGKNCTKCGGAGEMKSDDKSDTPKKKKKKKAES